MEKRIWFSLLMFISVFSLLTSGNFLLSNKKNIIDKCTTKTSKSSISTSILTIQSPNGGEIYPLGKKINIEWNSSGLSNPIKITLWKDDLFIGLIGRNISVSSGSFLWTVGEYSGGMASLGTGYKIKIKEQGTAVGDFSDSNFEIINSELMVLNPNGGEKLGLGGKTNIEWNSSELIGNIKITLWKDETRLGLIANNIPSSSTQFIWTIGNYSGGFAPAGTGYKIKIKEKGTSVSDFSDTDFELIDSYLSIQSPNGGERLELEKTIDIVWNSNGISNPIKITLWKDDQLVGIVANNIDASSGIYQWTIGSYTGGMVLPGTGYKIKIKEKNTRIADTSDSPFSVFSGRTIQVKNYHPRLLLNGNSQSEGLDDLNRIRIQLQSGIYQHAFDQADILNGEGNSGRFGGLEMLKMFRAIKDETYRNQYINEAKALISSGSYYQRQYKIMFILAMFDWFRSNWNDIETEQLISYMKECVKRDEWTNKTVLGNHFHEDHAIIRILPGLILKGESAGSESGDDLWFGFGSGSNGAKGAKYWMEQELKPTFRDFFGSFGICPEGNSYWNKGHSYLVTIAMAWTSCTNENLFQTWNMTNLPKGLLYLWRFSDGKLLPWSDMVGILGSIGETNRQLRYGSGYRSTFTTFLPIMRWKNSREAAFIYKSIASIPENLIGITANDTGLGYGDIFIKYIFGDAFGPRDNIGDPLNDPEPINFDSLPKSIFLDKYQAVIIRSGWERDDTLFGYKQNKYIAGHDNADAGSFIISRDVGLALDSGYYSSNGDVLDEHTQYYSPRTIAHNTITVFKPGQFTNVQYWSAARNVSNDDGGQRGFGREDGDGTIPGNYDAPMIYNNYLDAKYNRGRIHRYEYRSSKGYTYFFGDVTPAYFSDSVSNFTRTVLSPDSKYYIILDRISSTNNSYPKRWLLHTENELIAVNGVKGGQNGSDGSIVYTGNEFYTENGTSRLFVKMLMPQNNQNDTLLFRGGSGFEYWYGYDGSGFNADEVHDRPSANENPGRWRVEEKIVGELDSIFLNVLYATNNSTQSIGNVALLTNTSSNIIGVTLKSNIVVFSKAETKGGNNYLNEFTYLIPNSNLVTHIITDLFPNTLYSIYDNNQLKNTIRSSNQGIISFETSMNSGNTCRITRN